MKIPPEQIVFKKGDQLINVKTNVVARFECYLPDDLQYIARVYVQSSFPGAGFSRGFVGVRPFELEDFRLADPEPDEMEKRKLRVKFASELPPLTRWLEADDIIQEDDRWLNSNNPAPSRVFPQGFSPSYVGRRLDSLEGFLNERWWLLLAYGPVVRATNLRLGTISASAISGVISASQLSPTWVNYGQIPPENPVVGQLWSNRNATWVWTGSSWTALISSGYAGGSYTPTLPMQVGPEPKPKIQPEPDVPLPIVRKRKINLDL